MFKVKIGMQTQQGAIFDIQPFSVHDGPGSRTTIFLSGCPLRCKWCSNPESWNVRPQLMFARSKCKPTQCARCVKTCEKEALSFDAKGSLQIDREKCSDCTTFECAQACYHEALSVNTTVWHLDDLMKVLERDRQYWGGKGGVTFSGGEPFRQKDFLLQALKRCKKAYIHTAIETTAFVDTASFLEVMEYVDFAFIDVKHMNTEEHRHLTGVSPDLIWKNIQALKQSTWQGRVVLRMPVVPGYNDNMENMIALMEFMQDNGLVEVNLLPYHRLGTSKWEQIGEEYELSGIESQSTDELNKVQELFLNNGIACYLGDDTFF